MDRKKDYVKFCEVFFCHYYDRIAFVFTCAKYNILRPLRLSFCYNVQLSLYLKHFESFSIGALINASVTLTHIQYPIFDDTNFLLLNNIDLMYADVIGAIKLENI